MQSKVKKKSDGQFLDDMKVAGYFRPQTLQPQLNPNWHELLK
jgi:predicted NodU family carbamoyl transferase